MDVNQVQISQENSSVNYTYKIKCMNSDLKNKNACLVNYQNEYKIPKLKNSLNKCVHYIVGSYISNLKH